MWRTPTGTRSSAITLAALLLVVAAPSASAAPTPLVADVAADNGSADNGSAHDDSIDNGSAADGSTDDAPAGGRPSDEAGNDASSGHDSAVATSTATSTSVAMDGRWFSPTTVPLATTTTTTAAEPPVVTMAFTGDFLWHSPLWRQAERNAVGDGHPYGTYDFRPMLAEIAPYVAAVDLAVCHLETPIAPEGEAFSTYPDGYGVPAATIEAIAAAGFDRCSTASNHTIDRGLAGIDRTVDVLEANGLGQSGMAREPAEIEPQIFEVEGFLVSHLSYTFSYNGRRMPDEQHWRSALIDQDRILADAATARSLGAELVIVSLHWGAEGSHGVGSDQRRLAEALTASGDVDLIVGHHAHVLQPIEQVNGVWVMFGLGNVISNLPTSDRWPAATQDAALALIDAERRPDGSIVIGRPVLIPTWVDRNNGWVIRAIPDRLADPDTRPGLRDQLERSLARTTKIVGDFLTP